MAKHLPKVIGLKGRARSGKSTCAEYLEAKYGYQRVRFAGPLKAMLAAIGLTDDDIEGANKESPSRLLFGHSPRYAMQSLGSSWGRELHPDFWVNLWRIDAESQIRQGAPGIVAEDVRFYNEASAVHDLNGVVIEIGRQSDSASRDPEALHISERQDFKADIRLHNDGFDRDALYRSVEGVFEYLARERVS